MQINICKTYSIEITPNNFLVYNKIMDIFVIETIDADNVHVELLKQFQKKEISNSEKWNEHCLSYLMVDRILKEFYQIENRKIVFYGKKPFLEERQKFFSISHSNGYIAIAFSDYDCGVDIEKIKLRDFGSISKKMGFNCNTLEDFYNEWTKYEAEYKLGKPAQKFKKYNLNEYILTAASVNIQEDFEIYIQNGEVFPNANA